jgi:hypothetical protein
LISGRAMFKLLGGEDVLRWDELWISAINRSNA